MYVVEVEVKGAGGGLWGRGMGCEGARGQEEVLTQFDLQGFFGRSTPMYFAVRGGMPGIVEKLLAAGAKAEFAVRELNKPDARRLVLCD